MGRGRDGDRHLDEIDALSARIPNGAQGDAECSLMRADVELGRGHPDRAIALLQAQAKALEHSGERIG